LSACLTENTVLDALDGELSPGHRAKVQAHLDECEQCRRLVDMMTATSVAASGMSRAAASTSAAGEVAASAARPAARLPEPGTSVGRYRLERVIGEGGMGVVYAARDPELDRPVAIKIIRPQLGGASETMEQRLVRESRAMAQLAHPNVLAVHDVGRTDGQVFIAMELAAGGTLGAWVTAERRGWREVVARFCLAGRGLQAAHETGLVHRDFKAENVLLTADGGVRVADFGLVGSGTDPAPAGEEGSALADGPPLRFSQVILTRTGARLGTPLYMAPEQHDGRRVGPAADQFAFAVALYEALYGEHPFPATTYADLLLAVHGGRVREAPEASEVPGAVREVLLRALRVDPQARWPSMAALLDAVDRAMARAAQVAEPDSAEVRARVASLRHRLGQARGLAEAGKFGDALLAARAVSEEAAGLAYPPLRAEALYRQGLLETESGDQRAAQKTLSEAVVEAARARDDALAARIWSELLIVVGHREGRSAEAQLLRPAAEAALARCGDDPGVQVRFLTSLGIVLSDGGRYGEARDSFERAAALCEAAFGPFDLQLATAHNNLGYVKNRLADYDQARAHHERARAIWEHVLDPDHPSVASSLNNMGEVALEQGRHGEAEVLLERGLAIREQAFRPEHPFIALSLHNLAGVRAGQGRTDEALALHERALAIRLAGLGAEHADTAESLNGLGAALVALGRLEEGRAQHERALAVTERALGVDHVRVAPCANHLGDALCALGLAGPARAQHERALALAERVLGADHPHTARSLAGLARADLALGRPDVAAQAARRALDIAAQRGLGSAVLNDLRGLLDRAAAAR
jgi:eukaryotic-like serine/threonine-protein kinase